MDYTRREFGKIALATATLPLASWELIAAAKPNSTFGGVQIGTITYSFRSLPSSAEQVLQYCLDCGIDGIELMSNVAENYAGSPQAGRGGGPGGPPPGAAAAGGPPSGGAAAGGPPAGAGAPGGQGRGRAALTPEQQAERQKRAEELKAWRLAVPMAKYKAFRKMYEDAGVKIYAFKLPPTLEMSDEEYAYIWNVAETLGSNHVTMELPTEDALLARVASYAAKRKLRIAFHTHGQGGASGFEKVLSASKYTALNFDVGHYYGVNGESPVPLVQKYHDRIASLHLKDRKGPGVAAPESAQPGAGGQGRPGGPNMPWGQGETPLKDVLQLMKKEKYKFPASIEYEYQTPEGSDVLTEIKKCVEYCKRALA
ncbi:MAG: sugar phosphate isomerase/epimerase [Acidobacteria bacterium]|nr:sugar phosphate isomerase/epimerase [Acidobacteriota bacterium]